MGADEGRDGDAETLPLADVTDAEFCAAPAHWVNVAVRGTRFRITKDDRPFALLVPVVLSPNGLESAS